MTTLVTYDASGNSVAALGHPTECTEPAPGKVSGSASHNITVTNAAGESSGFVIADDSPSLEIPTHSHKYSNTDNDNVKECHDTASHSISTSSIDTSKFSDSVTINGSSVMIVNTGYATDPKSGGNVNVVAGGVNNSITEGES